MSRQKRLPGAPTGNENAMRKIGHVYTKQVSITLPEDLLLNAQNYSKLHSMKLSQLIANVLRNYLKEET